MLLSGFKVLHGSYRSCIFNAPFIFNASRQTKLISFCNDKLRTKFVRYYCNKSVTVTFQFPDGTLIKRSGKVGETIRSTIEENDPEFPGYGICCGGIICGSCHVILSEDDYVKLGEPGVFEADLLADTPIVTPTSRLACAMKLGPEVDGMILKIPKLY